MVHFLSLLPSSINMFSNNQEIILGKNTVIQCCCNLTWDALHKYQIHCYVSYVFVSVN